VDANPFLPRRRSRFGPRSRQTWVLYGAPKDWLRNSRASGCLDAHAFEGAIHRPKHCPTHHGCAPKLITEEFGLGFTRSASNPPHFPDDIRSFTTFHTGQPTRNLTFSRTSRGIPHRRCGCGRPLPATKQTTSSPIYFRSGISSPWCHPATLPNPEVPLPAVSKRTNGEIIRSKIGGPRQPRFATARPAAYHVFKTTSEQNSHRPPDRPIWEEAFSNGSGHRPEDKRNLTLDRQCRDKIPMKSLHFRTDRLRTRLFGFQRHSHSAYLFIHS